MKTGGGEEQAPVTYVASAVVRGKEGWTGSEFDLGGVADVDEIADRLRDVDPDADVSLLFVEADDTYLVILRLDEGEDLRVFGSDSALAHESRLGALLLSDVELPALEIEEAIAEVESGEDQEETAVATEADPVGDADLLADLGMSSHRLLATCAREGMLPADVTAEVAHAIGCGDELEELREA
jgi:putative tRNA adenosine deaminase-associated protein